MKELTSPLAAKEYRNIINTNFKNLQESLETYSSNSMDVDNELFDRLDSLGYLKDLNVALNKKLTNIEQTQTKTLCSIDILYKNSKVIENKLDYIITEMKRLPPKKWYIFW